MTPVQEYDPNDAQAEREMSENFWFKYYEEIELGKACWRHENTGMPVSYWKERYEDEKE